MDPEHPRDAADPSAPTARFSSRATEYARHRPAYPADVIDAIVDGMGDPATLAVADVGAGTGISARLLGDRGARVVAIEPNRAMREAAAAHPRVTWRDATAEETGLDDRSVDLVLCAQSFHWFRPDDALAEFRRVLRPDGRLALVWNDRDRSDPFSDGYYRIVLSTPEGSRVSGSWATEHPLASHEGWGQLREHRSATSQRFDLDGLLGRARSASYVPKEGPVHDRIVRELVAHHAAFADAAGGVTMRYETRLFSAAAAPASA